MPSPLDKIYPVHFTGFIYPVHWIVSTRNIKYICSFYSKHNYVAQFSSTQSIKKFIPNELDRFSMYMLRIFFLPSTLDRFHSVHWILYTQNIGYFLQRILKSLYPVHLISSNQYIR